MNEEELKVIKELKEEINKPFKMEEDIFNSFILFDIKSAKIILNLIDKLQKENEELKEEIENWKFTHKYVEENYIHKDKIREIVEKTYNDIDYFNRDIRKDLEDLLKE